MSLQEISPVQETPEPVVENVESSSTSEAYESTFKEIESFLKDFKGAVSRMKTLKREIVSMEKSLRKHEERKERRKRASLDENGNKRKNGFTLENNLISDELADFIDYEHGKPISRSEVTRRLTSYVKKHELQDPDDRRYVNLDTEAGKKLRTLLSDIVDNDGNPTRLTIITINKYVNKHYVGKVTPPIEEIKLEVKEVVETKPVKEEEDETKAAKEEVENKAEKEKMAATKKSSIKKKKLIKKKVAAA